MFNNIDTDQSNTITLEELNVRLKKFGLKLNEAEIRRHLDYLDSRNKLRDKILNFSPILCHYLHRHKIENKVNLWKVVQHCHRDDNRQEFSCIPTNVLLRVS